VLSPAATADAVVDVGRLALLFGRTDRITYHEDGVTAESDTDHTVMLGLVACALARHVRADLDIGLVAQYALVHDLVEAYAGDTNTLRVLDEAGRADKARREAAAYQRIAAEFGDTLPWLPATIAEYERRATPEARYVKALDKLLPKVTHIGNGLATIREQGMDAGELQARYTAQIEELRAYAADFPALFELRAELVGRVLNLFGAGDGGR
jgi:putative hydrolases of HD superfamily